MIKGRKKIFHKDKRGEIADIIYKHPYEAVTVILSKKGAARGNHLHKDTVQTVYLHSGKLKSFTRQPGGEIERVILKPGEYLTTEEHEEHELIALEDSIFYVFTRGPRSGMDYEKDTFRLKHPLHEEVRKPRRKQGRG